MEMYCFCNCLLYPRTECIILYGVVQKFYSKQLPYCKRTGLLPYLSKYKNALPRRECKHWQPFHAEKFPHSPILHYVFSSWIEKTMTKTIHCHWENRFVFIIVWGCVEILSIIVLIHVVSSSKKQARFLTSLSKHKLL